MHELFSECTNDAKRALHPAGAGKTNIAMLTVLHELAQHVGQRDPRKPDEFKIVYVAPMKALAAEVASAFCECLRCRLTCDATERALSVLALLSVLNRKVMRA